MEKEKLIMDLFSDVMKILRQFFIFFILRIENTTSIVQFIMPHLVNMQTLITISTKFVTIHAWNLKVANICKEMYARGKVPVNEKIRKE